MSALHDLEQDLPEYYPGSSRPLVRHPNRPEEKPEGKHKGDWDAEPHTLTVAGVEREFFTIGQLAAALGRQAVTIRKWEREGIIPKATYAWPAQDPRGKRRLYTRKQVEGIVRIAHEEGVLDPVVRKQIKATSFTEKVVALFKTLGTEESL